MKPPEAHLLAIPSPIATGAAGRTTTYGDAGGLEYGKGQGGAEADRRQEPPRCDLPQSQPGTAQEGERARRAM